MIVLGSKVRDMSERAWTIMLWVLVGIGLIVFGTLYAPYLAKAADVPMSWTSAGDDRGIEWMDRATLVQSIPPDYSEHIGRYAMLALQGAHD